MNRNIKNFLLCSSLLAAGSARANLLLNGDFSAPGLGATAVSTNLYPGPCAATDWEVFQNTSGTVDTEIVTPPAGLPTGSPTSLLFDSNSENSEIDQEFLTPPAGGPATISAWVYLIRGGVGLGVGNGGAVGYNDYTTTKDTWIYLSYHYGGPSNNAIVGTAGVDGGEFYVADAKVTSTPAPAALASFVFGLPALRKRPSKKA